MNGYKFLCTNLFPIYFNRIDFALVSFIIICFLSGCANEPRPINLSTDSCTYCGMAISKAVFAAEIITPKGKALKFDDLHCVEAFIKEKESTMEGEDIYLVNFMKPHNFIPAEEAFLLQSSELHSPMGGNTAAFETLEDLLKIQKERGGKQMSIYEFMKEKE